LNDSGGESVKVVWGQVLDYIFHSNHHLMSKREMGQDSTNAALNLEDRSVAS
jgi:hypothetical protein